MRSIMTHINGINNNYMMSVYEIELNSDNE